MVWEQEQEQAVQELALAVVEVVKAQVAQGSVLVPAQVVSVQEQGVQV